MTFAVRDCIACVLCLLSAGACSGGDNGRETAATDSGVPRNDGGDGQTGQPREESLQSLPSVWQEHAGVALNGEIYVVGGFTPMASASVAAYDPSSNRWRRVADLPSVLHHANAAVVGNTLYVAGFYAGGGFSNVDGRIFSYNPAQDAWAARGSMPAGTQRASACVAVLETKIFLFGGARGGTVSDVSAYDTALDEWEALPALPEPREHCVAGAIEGTVYIASGRSAGIGGFQPKTWAYDPVARRYEEKAAIPTPRGGTAGAVLASKLFVFGGEGNSAVASGVFADVEAYDPRTNTWERLADMLVPRHGFGAATIGSRIYLPGGATQQAFGAVDAHSVFVFE